MSKNNKLINSMKIMVERNRKEYVEKASNDIVPPIYAAIALALHKECGFGYKRINDVFLSSQNIWESHVGNLQAMIDLCEEETGIKVIFQETSEPLKQNGVSQ